ADKQDKSRQNRDYRQACAFAPWLVREREGEEGEREDDRLHEIAPSPAEYSLTQDKAEADADRQLPERCGGRNANRDQCGRDEAVSGNPLPADEGKGGLPSDNQSGAEKQTWCKP